MGYVMPPPIVVGLGLLALAGCTQLKALEGPPTDLRKLYDTSLSTPPLHLRRQARTAAAGDPLLSLLQPPSVQKVWVPAQRTPEGDLVAGHWVYLLLETPEWRLEEALKPGLPLAPLPLPTPTPTPPDALGLTQTPEGFAAEAYDRRLPVRPLVPSWPPAPGEAP